MEKVLAIPLLLLFLAIIANAQEQPKPEPEAIVALPWFLRTRRFRLLFPHEPHQPEFPFSHPHPHLHPHGFQLPSLSPNSAPELPLPHHPRFRFPFLLPTQPPTSPNTYSEKIEVFDEQVKFPYHHRRRMASEEQKECFMAVHDKKMGACLHDFRNYIMTHNIKLGAKCCGALEKIEDACQPLVKHPLPLLEGVITHHCFAAAPSPSS